MKNENIYAVDGGCGGVLYTPPPENPDKIIPQLDTIDGNSLMAIEFPPLEYALDKILPHGLFILAGSPKSGKSWLALDICISVATGESVWDFAAEHGDVLYLALEDNHRRLNGRLRKAESAGTDVSRLHLATSSFGINSGLIEQINGFLTVRPETKLIVIDTLEHIRDTAFDKSIYSCDYRDMNALREIIRNREITLLLIHHTRKMHDPDPLNTLSGSTGLVGSVDGVWVLDKESRTENKARLTIANRDTEDYCFSLELDRDNCKWRFIGNIVDLEAEEQSDDWLCRLVDGFLGDKKCWSGTATELSKALNEIDGNEFLSALNIKKKLSAKKEMLNAFGISVRSDTKGRDKILVLARSEASGEGCV